MEERKTAPESANPEFVDRHRQWENHLAQAWREVEEARARVARHRAGHLHELAIALHQWGALTAESGDAQALAATSEAVALARELASIDDDWNELLAGGLINLALCQGRRRAFAPALKAAEEAVDVFRRLCTADDRQFLRGLVTALNALSLLRREAELRQPAVEAASESAVLARRFFKRAPEDPQRAQLLAACLANAGTALQQTQQHAEALTLLEEAVERMEPLAGLGSDELVNHLAIGLTALGVSYSKVGRRSDAIAPSRRAVDLLSAVVDRNEALLPSWVGMLGNLAARHFEAEQPELALPSCERAYEGARRLAGLDRPRFLLEEARAAGNLSMCLQALGRTDDSLVLVERSIALYREIDAAGAQDVKAELAGQLNNRAGRLLESGRHDEALEPSREGLQIIRECAAVDPVSYGPDLVMHLNTIGGPLLHADRPLEALPLIEEAAALTTRMVATHRGAFLALHAATIGHLSTIAFDAGRRDEGAVYAAQAAAAFRELAAEDRRAHLPGLARSLTMLGAVTALGGDAAAALVPTQEALALYRELAGSRPAVFGRELLVCLGNVADQREALGQAVPARALRRESARLLLDTEPTDPHGWVRQAERVTAALDDADDLAQWHLPLLRQLPEHRELAYDAAHADALLRLQAQIAARAWSIAGTLAPDLGETLDEVAAALLSTMHSPDLARWMQARGADDDGVAELARCKRDVMAADQLLHALLLQLQSGPGPAGGLRNAEGGAVDGAAALQQRIERQQQAVRAARAAFRARRRQVIGADARLRFAFDDVGPAHLRACAGQHGTDAALFLLQLTMPERAVGVLVPAGPGPVTLLAFDGLVELAAQAAAYRPHGGTSRAMRSADAAPPASGPQTPLATLAERLGATFWARLDAALAGADRPLRRLHVCCHGSLHELPLGLGRDAPRVHLWPGLPYLRLAASAAPEMPGGPWLLGHDCAWNSPRPLPMTAIETALLRHLLDAHGRRVTAVEPAAPSESALAPLQGRWEGLVACCHGQREDAHFETALALGGHAMSVADIVQGRCATPLALLPACHAGETRDDAAGNSLGIAAAFLLGGTRVVAASSKAVPDRLMPWLSTLAVWHVLDGQPRHDAALLAREQVGRLDFPDGYRRWLQVALPHALKPLQPGGEEHPPTTLPQARRALRDLCYDWPWEGETQHLFSADPALREQAAASMAAGVLTPRGGAEGAQALTAECREMTGFLTVYGVQ